MKGWFKYFLFVSITANIGNAQPKQERIDSFLTYLRTPATDTTKALALNGIISFYLQSGNLKMADSLNEVLTKLAAALNFNKGNVSALMNKGRFEEMKGAYTKAMEYYFEVLARAKKLNQVEIEASVMNDIGVVYFTQGSFDKALEYYKQAIFKMMTYGDKRLGAVLNNTGNIYFNRKQYDIALEYYQRSLKIRESRNDKNGISNSLNNIGNVYLELNQYDKALDFFKQAEYIQVVLANNIDLSYTYLNEGLAYDKLGKPGLAEQLFLKGVELSTRINFPDAQRDGYLSLSNLYEKGNDPGKALKYYKKFIDIRDKLKNDALRKELESKEMKFEYTKKELQLRAEEEKKDVKRNEEAKRERTTIYASFSVLGLVLVFAVISFKRFKTTQKQKFLIEEQKKLVDHKQKEVIDSINYAKRLQNAILVPEDLLMKSFSEAFIIYRPKDIVSGDFYWFTESEHNKLIAVADCTGHGVPGGFMSMLGYETLQNVVLRENISTTSESLKTLDKKITETLNKSARTFRDGMDMALCAFSKKTNSVQFSGANRPLIQVSHGNLTIHKPNKFPIGGDIDGTDKKFTHIDIPIVKGDSFFLFTDGYADQFGGPRQKKLMLKQMEELLQVNAYRSLSVQKQLLEELFDNWKGSLEQVDDVCVIGIRV